MTEQTEKTDLITPADASQLLNVGVNCLARWRAAGANLPYYKLGRGVRYSRAEVLAFMARSRRLPDQS